MKPAILFLILSGSILTGCQRKSHFTETIIDNQAPQNVWLKTVGDINQDGFPDMIAGGENGKIVAYLAPDWKKQLINDTIKVSTDGEVCDLNNDGIQDLVIIADKALIWLSGPDWEYHLIDSVVLHDIEVADFDNDGIIDIVGRNQAEWGTGDTLFTYHQKPVLIWTKYTKAIVNGEGLKVADINKDKLPDILVNGYWFENTGNIQNWNEHKFSDTWRWRNSFIDVADMNNDGLTDILLSPSELQGQTYHISWFEAHADRALIWKEHIVADSVETVVHFIGAADFNLDGKMDFMIADMKQGVFPHEVAVFYNHGTDNWEKEVISTEGSHSIRLFDFDHDGDMDAFGANHQENIVKMWLNNNK